MSFPQLCLPSETKQSSGKRYKLDFHTMTSTFRWLLMRSTSVWSTTRVNQLCRERVIDLRLWTCLNLYVYTQMRFNTEIYHTKVKMLSAFAFLCLISFLSMRTCSSQWWEAVCTNLLSLNFQCHLHNPFRKDVEFYIIMQHHVTRRALFGKKNWLFFK